MSPAVTPIPLLKFDGFGEPIFVTELESFQDSWLAVGYVSALVGVDGSAGATRQFQVGIQGEVVPPLRIME